jgi:glycosyltransferase involved in cell wall biosynthesis
LDSVAWSNDIVVLDSFSTDDTAAIVRGYPAVRFLQHHFRNFSDQRNFGLHETAFFNPWVLIIDADEVVDAALRTEMRSVIQSRGSEAISVFLLRRHVVFDQRVLRWNTTSSFWIGRLVRPGHVHYEGKVHERLVFSGQVGKLRGRLIHDQFSKGLEHWRARSRRYAELEAVAPREVHFRRLFSSDPLQRRSVLKRMFYALPGAWMGYLVFNILLSGAFLDGWRGLRYIYLQAQYHKWTATNIRRTQNA